MVEIGTKALLRSCDCYDVPVVVTYCIMHMLKWLQTSAYPCEYIYYIVHNVVSTPTYARIRV